MAGTFVNAVARLAYLANVARILLRSNLRSRFRRTLFGHIWLVVPGLASAAAFSLLRNGDILSVGHTDIPYPLFVLSGIFLWQAFVDALNLPTQQLFQQRRFLSLVPAPFEAVVLAALGEVLLNLAIRLSILLVAMLLIGLTPHASWLLISFAGLCMVTVGLAVGLLLAPFAQLYEDVASLTGLAATFGVFLAPIFYPVPANSWLALNPLGWPIGAAHDWMIDASGSVAMFALWLVSLLLLLPAWAFNAISRPHIAARAI